MASQQSPGCSARNRGEGSPPIHSHSSCPPWQRMCQLAAIAAGGVGGRGREWEGPAVAGSRTGVLGTPLSQTADIIKEQAFPPHQKPSCWPSGTPASVPHPRTVRRGQKETETEDRRQSAGNVHYADRSPENCAKKTNEDKAKQGSPTLPPFENKSLLNCSIHGNRDIWGFHNIPSSRACQPGFE